MRKIAIGDIHGCAHTFKKLIEKVELGQRDELILLGDLIDRGPDSKGVLDEILRLRKKGQKVVLVKGNHEEMMLNAHIDFMVKNRWLNSGGRMALASFGGVNLDLSVVDPIYFSLLGEGLDYYETDGFIFVHAGLNFGLEFPYEAVRDMRWIRDWHDEINYKWLGGRVIVHGHSPRTVDFIRQMQVDLPQKQVLDIDSGCCYVEKAGMGVLTAYDATSDALFFQDYVG